MTELRGATNAKAKAELGWTPSIPSWREGFARPAHRRLDPNGRIDERARPAPRGTAIGTAWRERIRAGWEGYERLFAAASAGPGLQREVAERSLERTRSWAPALARRSTGSRPEPGSSPGASPRSTPGPRCWRRRARRRPASARRSSVAPPGGGPPRTIQTWDWYEDLRDNVLLLTVETGPAGPSTCSPSSGSSARSASTRPGSASTSTSSTTRDDGGAAGVPVHVVARRILDEAATVEEATAIARSATVSASTRPHRRRLGRRARERPLPRALSRRRRRARAGRRRRARSTPTTSSTRVLARGERPTDFDATTRAGSRRSAAGSAGCARRPMPRARAGALVDHESGICSHAGDDQPSGRALGDAGDDRARRRRREGPRPSRRAVRRGGGASWTVA